MSLSIEQRREMLISAERELSIAMRLLGENQNQITTATTTLREILADDDTSSELAELARQGLVTAAAGMAATVQQRLHLVETRALIAAADARLDELD